MKDLNDAIESLSAGDWRAAHAIVQEDDSELGSWAHAIVHLMEGDIANAGYWYRRAGRSAQGTAAIAREIEALQEAVRNLRSEL